MVSALAVVMDRPADPDTWVPVAPVTPPAPGQGSVFIDADDHVHVVWPQPGGLAYSLDGRDVYAGVRAVASRWLR